MFLLWFTQNLRLCYNPNQMLYQLLINCRCSETFTYNPSPPPIFLQTQKPEPEGKYLRLTSINLNFLLQHCLGLNFPCWKAVIG